MIKGTHNEAYQKIKSMAEGVKPKGKDSFMAKCIINGHDEKIGSMNVTYKDDKLLINCFGCNADFNDFIKAAGMWEDPCTLTEYAAAKQLPVDFLTKEFGLKEYWGGIEIPHRNEDGKVTATQLRIRMRKASAELDGRFYWEKGSRAGESLCGLEKINDFKGDVFIVEGASDTQAGRFHGIDVLGIPGKSIPKRFCASKLTEHGFDRVYAVVEPDAVGQFEVDLADALHRAKFKGELFAIYPDNSEKDLSEIHVRHNGDFDTVWQEYIDSAKPVEIKFNEKPTPSENKAEASLNNELRLTDAGHAERFATALDGKFLYIENIGWLAWTGKYWAAEGAEARLTRACIKFGRDWGKQMFEQPHSPQRDAAIRFASHCESAGRIKNTLSLSRHMPEFFRLAEQLDGSPMLFNCFNGTLNLLDGKLQPHNPADMITQRSSVKYDPEATAPRFEQFLHEIIDDAEIVQYIQQFLGMCLSADISEETLPIFWGSGQNGKSSLLDTVSFVMGDYATDAAPDLLIEKKHNGHSTEIFDLMQKRLALAEETKKDTALRLDFVKKSTGNDTLKARKMGHDFVEFKRTHKTILCTNNKPLVGEKTVAIWRRLRLVPFTITISDDKRDKKLKQKLKDESPGILNWLLEGCLQWQKSGIVEPQAVIDATDSYRREQDHFGEYYEDRCVGLGDVGSTPVSQLWEDYLAWCKTEGVRPISRKDLSVEMKALGHNKKSVRVGGTSTKCFVGIGLKVEESYANYA